MEKQMGAQRRGFLLTVQRLSAKLPLQPAPDSGGRTLVFSFRNILKRQKHGRGFILKVWRKEP